MPNTTELQTRQLLIDQALSRAGWDLNDHTQVGQEIPVDGTSAFAWQRVQAKLRAAHGPGLNLQISIPTGITDYVLYYPTGEILAVVEAKRTSVDPRIAQAQTEFYVEQLEQRQSFRPFAFMTNG